MDDEYQLNKEKALEAGSWLVGTISDIQKRMSEKDQTRWIEHAFACVRAVYGPLAPFQPGDRVVLRDPPVITKEDSWGWVGHEHMLCAGKPGRVSDVDWDDERQCYRVGFEPDAQTWIHYETGKALPVDRPATYWLAAKRFEKEAERNVCDPQPCR